MRRVSCIVNVLRQDRVQSHVAMKAPLKRAAIVAGTTWVSCLLASLPFEPESEPEPEPPDPEAEPEEVGEGGLPDALDGDGVGLDAGLVGDAAPLVGVVVAGAVLAGPPGMVGVFPSKPESVREDKGMPILLQVFSNAKLTISNGEISR